MRNAEELQLNLTAAKNKFTAEDAALLQKLQTHPAFTTALNENHRRFHP